MILKNLFKRTFLTWNEYQKRLHEYSELIFINNTCVKSYRNALAKEALK